MGNIFRKHKEIRILMQGLDAAGKTTILYKLKLGEVVTTIPTISFNVETVTINNMSFVVLDLGSHSNLRPLYRHYYPNTQVLIYVIDSTDANRFDDARYELHSTLTEDEPRDTPVLVLVNKQDLPQAYSVEYVTEKLQLYKVRRKCHVFGTSAVTGEGLKEALDWISAVVNGTEDKLCSTQAKNVGTENSKLSQQTNLSSNSYLWNGWRTLYKLFVSD